MYEFNVAFKHKVISRRCLLLAVVFECAATQECHAANTGHDTHPITVYRHRAVAVLSIDVERHTGIHSYAPILMS